MSDLCRPILSADKNCPRKSWPILMFTWSIVVQFLLAHAAEDDWFSTLFFLLFVSITVVGRIPWSRLLLVRTKIYQCPRLPNLSLFCNNCLSQWQHRILSADINCFQLCLKTFLSAEKNCTTKSADLWMWVSNFFC